jgi:hypothetical protein
MVLRAGRVGTKAGTRAGTRAGWQGWPLGGESEERSNQCVPKVVKGEVLPPH